MPAGFARGASCPSRPKTPLRGLLWAGRCNSFGGTTGRGPDKPRHPRNRHGTAGFAPKLTPWLPIGISQKAGKPSHEWEMISFEQARHRYAEELRFTARVSSPAVVGAFATVPREFFVGPGPWRIKSPMNMAE